jgi:hypothetical protein
MKKITFLSVIMLIALSSVFSQENLLLNNGKRILISEIKIDTSGIILYKNIEGNVKWIEFEEVFSWTRDDSVEVIFYKPACEDVCFRIDQMRDYLHGEADGNNVHTYGASIISFIAGAGSGILMPVAGLYILSPIPPAVNSGLWGAFRPNADKFEIPEKYKDNSHYKEGFTSSVRRKRVVNSLITGASGLVTGIVLITVLK